MKAAWVTVSDVKGMSSLAVGSHRQPMSFPLTYISTSQLDSDHETLC